MWLLAYVILTPGVPFSVEDSIGIGWVCQTCEQIKQAKTLINISAYMFKLSLKQIFIKIEWYCNAFECCSVSQMSLSIRERSLCLSDQSGAKAV